MRVKIYFVIFILSSICAVSTQSFAQGNRVVLDGNAYLSGNMPSSFTQGTYWTDGRVIAPRLGFATDQVVREVGQFGTLYVRAVSGGVTNLEFVPGRSGGGTCTINITGYTAGFMYRAAFAPAYSKYFLQVWDLRGRAESYLSAQASTTNTTNLVMGSVAHSIGAKPDGTLKFQAKFDFVRDLVPIGLGHAPIADSPFPQFSGSSDYNFKLLRYEFENNLNNDGTTTGVILTNTGAISYEANSNTQPVARGEDRTGQSKGSLLLNATNSYDYEVTLTNTGTWTCVSVPAPLTCGSLTFRNSNSTGYSTWVEGATQTGTYTFSFQASDGTLTDTDSSITIEVVAVSASLSNVSCFAGETCHIDGSATTGHKTPDGVVITLGDGYSMNLKEGNHLFYNAGTFSMQLTARAYDGTTATANATATVTNRPAANAANTIDMTNATDPNFISVADCTGNPTGNMTKLQAALDTAKGRNTVPQKIIVRANNGSGTQCTYQGQLQMKTPAGTSQILFISSGTLPAPHKRITLSDTGQMPKILTTANNDPALTAASGHTPKYYKFEGLEFVSSATQQDGSIIEFAPLNSITQESLQPEFIVFSHCIVRPNSETANNVKNAFFVNGNDITIIDSRIGPNSYAGIESHGIGAVYVKRMSVVNNFNGGASISILMGGAPSLIEGAVSSDLEFRENYHFRDPAWQGDATRARAIKNLFELKNARRVVAQGNRMENNWVDGQAGHAILFQCVYDSGDWCRVQDLDFSLNFILNSTKIGTISAREYPALNNLQRFYFKNNLWQNINPSAFGASSNPSFALLGGPVEVSFVHNTMRQPNGDRTGDWSSFCFDCGEARAAGFQWIDNIADGYGATGGYGWFGDAVGAGATGTTKYAPNSTWKNSLSIADVSTTFPSYATGMQYPANEAIVQFTNAASNIWSLAAGSPYKNAASDGTDPGVDWAVLQAAIAHTQDGQWGGAPPAARRGIILNGSGQYGYVSALPSAAPYNSVGTFSIKTRLRAVTSYGFIFALSTPGGGHEVYALAQPSSGRIDFHDGRESPGLSIYHTPTDLNDCIIEFSFEPANSRWVVTSRRADGTGVVTSTGTITNTTNRNFSSYRLSIGTNYYGVSTPALKMDWFRWSAGAVQLATYEFDQNNGSDTSGNGQHLTLFGSPAFEDSPPEDSPPPAAQRGIILNGSGQYGYVSALPSAAPYNSVGTFSIKTRLRAVTTYGFIFALSTPGGGHEVYALAQPSSGRIDFHDGRESPGLSIYHTPTDLNDCIIEFSFEPANSRWVVTSRRADGTGVVTSTGTITNTTNRNFSSYRLSIGTNYYGVSTPALKMDWFRWSAGAVQLATYEFDQNDGSDTSGNGQHLTLFGSPAFEDSPPEN